MNLDISYLERCISTLERSLILLNQAHKDEIDYDMYRSACIKEFEIILEQSGKLLKKTLKQFFHSSKAVDQLNFKDIFRHAVLHSLIDSEACERWLIYRDNRNTLAHDYGIGFAEETLQILPQFIIDSRELVLVIQKSNN